MGGVDLRALLWGLAVVLLSGRLLMASEGAVAGGADFIAIDGGVLITGDPEGEPGEIERRVEIEPFGLMRQEVTNRAFAAF
ncbi:MAG: hypothetical protein OEU92_10225, partial [Alphaproteobacteria bacterium]|nr:hypothetical protein [Alphaproteobacteria bacterium]